MARRTRMTHRLTERWLREELIRLRSAKGWNIDRVVAETGLHKRTIERVERGPDMVSARSLDALISAYNPDAVTVYRLREMRGLAERVGWWDDWHDVHMIPAYAEHCELEQTAKGIDLYSTAFFNGLLQSPAYAAHAQNHSPQVHLRDGPVADRFIALRLERQRRCWAVRRVVRVLIDESMLTDKGWPQGPLAEQLDYVHALEERGLLTARVIPRQLKLAIPDTFIVFTAGGGKKAVCFGGFIEHHAEDDWSLARAREFFELAWRRAVPLFDNGRCKWI